MIKIAIVEDNPEHQKYFKIIIDNDPGLSCIAVYDNGEDAIDGIAWQNPDVVLMDIELPKRSGIECVRILKDKVPGVKFIMCTVFENQTYIQEAFKAGAHAFVLKTSKLHQLRSTIYEVMESDKPLDDKVTGSYVQCISAVQAGEPQPIHSISFAI